MMFFRAFLLQQMHSCALRQTGSYYWLHLHIQPGQGFSPVVIKERLGHDNIETTLQTYSHLYPSTKEDVISAIAKDMK